MTAILNDSYPYSYLAGLQLCMVANGVLIAQRDVTLQIPWAKTLYITYIDTGTSKLFPLVLYHLAIVLLPFRMPHVGGQRSISKYKGMFCSFLVMTDILMNFEDFQPLDYISSHWKTNGTGLGLSRSSPTTFHV